MNVIRGREASECDTSRAAALEAAVASAAAHLLARQRPDGHWVFELEADATIPAEYLMLLHFFGRRDAAREAAIGRYLRRLQAREAEAAGGGWPLSHGGPLDISCSVKAYLALKLIGDSEAAPHMRRARDAILAAGGAERCNVFTRAALALYGEVPWRAVPMMPPELMLLPRWFPFHVGKISYWARTVLIPLTVVMARRPRALNPGGASIRELFRTPPEEVREWPGGAHQQEPWSTLFRGLDAAMHRAQRLFPRTHRHRAEAACERFVTERLNGEDGLGAIFPAMANAVLMYHCLGIPEDDPRVRTAWRAVEKLVLERPAGAAGPAHDFGAAGPAHDFGAAGPANDFGAAGPAHAFGAAGPAHDFAAAGPANDFGAARPAHDFGAAGPAHAFGAADGLGAAGAAAGHEPGETYVQPCLSPVWDTALTAHALLEAGGAEAERAVARGLDWLVSKEVREPRGDWSWQRPGLQPGGWAFQYENAHYPDVDDTAAVVLALDRHRRQTGERDPARDAALARAVTWTVGMQSRGGGWGAFDADNTFHYLNHIPFADHGALLDPPTADVSGRCLAMLAQLGEGQGRPARDAVEYLLREQEADGSWYGRWGVNYIYGTWSAVTALNAAGLSPHDPAMRRAVAWLVERQNADGGWGEDGASYPERGGTRPDAARDALSSPSQTAWAMLALMAAGEGDSEAVARGAEWLVACQLPDGDWPEEDTTGTGFPRVFYLRYHGYRRIFPLWALARLRNLRHSNSRRVPHGL